MGKKNKPPPPKCEKRIRPWGLIQGITVQYKACSFVNGDLIIDIKIIHYFFKSMIITKSITKLEQKMPILLLL